MIDNMIDNPFVCEMLRIIRIRPPVKEETAQ